MQEQRAELEWINGQLKEKILGRASESPYGNFRIPSCQEGAGKRAVRLLQTVHRAYGSGLQTHHSGEGRVFLRGIPLLCGGRGYAERKLYHCCV